ncbi:acyltransferase [Parasalinivibrio latis]|uniref:acyltransferase n=1 Tax=Parasalinivibrio latis TaxID=2952610 RepID=UPI0030E4DA36
MTHLSIQKVKHWLKYSDSSLAKAIFAFAKNLINVEIPAPKGISKVLYVVYTTLRNLGSATLRVCWWTPLFKGRLSCCGKNLYLYGGLPFVSGPLDISVGNSSRISGQTTFSGRCSIKEPPKLHIGNNVDVGWQTTIAVGTQVYLGDNVRIAGRAFLCGYPGHPLNPLDRAKGLPEEDHQARDIVLEKDVWLGTGVTVMAGVLIGQGTVVAAGSVVTKSLPTMVLAGGNPAKVIRHLDCKPTPEEVLRHAS